MPEQNKATIKQFQSSSSHNCHSTVQSGCQTVLFIRWYNIITSASEIKYNSMNTRSLDINQWTSTSNISSTKPQEKALYQTVTNLTVHPGASYPLFSVSRGLCEHSLFKSLSWGSSTATHTNTLRLGATKHPIVTQSQTKAVEPWQNVCHKTRPTTGLRSDQYFPSNWLPNN